MAHADWVGLPRCWHWGQNHNWPFCDKNWLGKLGNCARDGEEMLWTSLLTDSHRDRWLSVGSIKVHLRVCSSRLVSQPEGCSCSSRCAWSGFNSLLHTSTFFLLLHLSLSFSCCEVLSCGEQRCFDSGRGGFPQGNCSFFHSHGRSR